MQCRGLFFEADRSIDEEQMIGKWWSGLGLEQEEQVRWSGGSVGAGAVGGELTMVW